MLNFRRRPELDHWIALAGFFVVALLYTLPLASKLASHVPGDNGDSIPHLWPFWYFPRAIFGGLTGDGGGSLFHPLMQLYPDGFSLVYTNSSFIGALLMTPISMLVSPAAGLNAWLMLHLWLGGWFFYRFCRNIGAGFWGGWLGGFAYACSPFVAIHIPGHFTLVQIGFTAAAFFSLSALVRRAGGSAGRGWRHWIAPSLGLGLSCWAVAATDFYLAVMTLLLLTAALIHLVLIHGRAVVSLNFIKPFALSVILSAVLLMPWVYLILQARSAGMDYSPPDPAMGSNVVAEWSRLVTLPAYHAVWGPRMYPEFVGKFPGISEYTYLGMIGLFVAFVGMVIRRDWRAGIVWTIAFLIALGLAGGNSYTTQPAWPDGHPLSFGKWWPRWFPLSEFRVPGRWQFALCTCLAVGVALGVDALVRYRRPGSRATFSLIIFGLMAFDLLRWPLPVTPAQAIDAGIETDKPGAVLDIPVGIRSGAGHTLGQWDRDTLLRQMHHGRPILSAHAARLPSNLVGERRSGEFLSLIEMQTGDAVTTRPFRPDWGYFIDSYNISTIRIPNDWPTSQAIRQAFDQTHRGWRWNETGGAVIGELPR